MMKLNPIPHARASAPARADWPLLAIMGVLFVGPLLAPLFQATRLPGIAGTGALARDLLSLYVCPTPAKSYMLLGFPMGVCARCWGATIGLWGAWLAVARLAPPMPRNASVLVAARRFLPDASISSAAGWMQRYMRMHWLARLGVSALPFWLWVAEISWWPAAPYWALLVNGAFAGFWAGLFFCSVVPFGKARR